MPVLFLPLVGNLLSIILVITCLRRRVSFPYPKSMPTARLLILGASPTMQILSRIPPLACSLLMTVKL